MIKNLVQLARPDNPVFVRARQGKRQPHVITATLVLFGVLIVAFVSFALVGEFTLGDGDLIFDIWGGMAFLVAPFLVMVLLIFLWVRFREKRPVASIGFSRTSSLKAYVRGLGVGALMIAVAVGFMAVSGSVEIENPGAAIFDITALGSVAILLAGFIIQGGTEEILIRGWYFQVIGARHKPWLGLLISTVVFTASHGSGSVLANLNLALFSLFLSFYFLYEGNLWGVMGFHSAWNWAMGNLFGLDVSGHGDYGRSLLNLKAVGSDILSGGTYGPEASILCTIPLIIGLIVLAMLAGKRKSQDMA